MRFLRSLGYYSGIAHYAEVADAIWNSAASRETGATAK